MSDQNASNATASNATAAGSAPVAANEALEQAQTGGALAERQSFMAGDVSGTEDITADDIQIPRLAIAQGLSPQMIPGDARHIPGLQMFEMFNDLTNDRYGQGPLYFIPLRREVRYIEFEPRVKGQQGAGGVIDLNVPPNDERTLWTWSSPELKAQGKKADVPPRATKFSEFIVLLLRPDGQPEMIMLSIAEKNKHNTRAAKRLTSFIKQQALKGRNSAPIYGCQYTVESKAEKFTEGTAGIFVINQAGRLDDPTQDDASWVRSAALFKYAKDTAAKIAGKTIVVNREPGDDTDFDPETLEGAGPSDKTDM